MFDVRRFGGRPTSRGGPVEIGECEPNVAAPESIPKLASVNPTRAEFTISFSEVGEDNSGCRRSQEGCRSKIDAVSAKNFNERDRVNFGTTSNGHA